MAEGGGGGLTQDQVQAQILAMMPKPGSSAPPPVAIDGAAGDGGGYARDNHTHESRLLARRVQLTFDANGEAVYVFPKPYAAGIVPIVTTTAENMPTNAYRYDATVKEGSATNIQAVIVLTKTPKTITTGVLGAVTSLFSGGVNTAWVNIMSRAPS